MIHSKATKDHAQHFRNVSHVSIKNTLVIASPTPSAFAMRRRLKPNRNAWTRKPLFHEFTKPDTPLQLIVTEVVHLV